MVTTYTLQRNINSTGWVTVKTGQISSTTKINYSFEDVVPTDVVEFRVLLTDHDYSVSPYATPSSSTLNFIKGEWTTETGIQTVKGKCSSAYEKQSSFRITGQAPWIVRVTRLTPDSTSSYLNNKTYFASIAYAIEEKFRYPCSVLVGTRVSAEQFSSIPTRSFRCKMLKVKVPTNYDPYLRTYTGIWNGSFKISWTDNPAWCFYDLVTNKRYGLGDRIPEGSVDKWSLYEIGQYCDELVPASDGTLEPRFTCNVLIQTREEAYKVVADFASIFRGMTYWGNGTIVPVQDSPKPIAYAFNNTNVVDGVFEYKSTNVSSRYNTAAVTWNNLDDFGRRWVEYVEDSDAIYRMGYVNEIAVVAFGCTSQGMARRVGRWLLYTNNEETDVVTFSTGIEGVLPRPGDAIKISDTLRSQERRGGRVKSSSSPSQIILDKPLTFSPDNTYTISTIDTDGGLQETTFTFDGTTDTLELGVPFAKAVAKDSIYIVADDNIEPQIFKVLSVTEGDDSKYVISALSHNPTKYAFIERSIPPTETALPNQLVYPADDLKALEVVYASGKQYKSRIEISWTKPLFGNSYRVSVKSDDGKVWNETITDNLYVVDEIPNGLYNISVTAINVLGVESQEAKTSITTGGKTWNPSNVSSITYQIVGNNTIALRWDEVPDIDIANYEVRKTNTGWGVADSNRVFFGNTTSFSLAPTSTNQTYYVRAFDNLNKYSGVSASVVAAVSVPSIVTPVSYTYADTSTTSSSVTLDWDTPSSDFLINYYLISMTAPGWASPRVVKIKTTEWTTQANWVGDATFSIKAVNIFGWESTVSNTTVTKELPPQVSTVAKTVSGTKLLLDWPDAVKTSLPIGGYEVRSSNTGWGTSGFLFKGNVSSYLAKVSVGSNTWYVKCYDTDSNYSATATTVSYTAAVPLAPTTATATFSDTSTTNAVVTLQWNDVLPVFGLAYYKISYGSVVKTTASNSIILPADWIGNRTFSIVTVDLLGGQSVAKTLVVEKLVPGPVTGFRASVIDNNVLLYWTLPAQTTLPVSHIRLKKGSAWATATDVGTKAGSFTSLFESSSGNYTYWAAAVDTDSNEGSPVSVTTKVSEPPDYVLHGELDSSFTGTKSSALLEQGRIVLPISTTETFAEHFSTRGWTTPSAQVSAGYPVYIQPSISSGYYEEIFDFGTILQGSKVTLNYLSTVIDGIPSIVFDISLSDDNVNWSTSNAVTEVYGTNFRYVKVRATVNSNGDATSVLTLDSLSVRLDAKLKNDAGKSSCLSSDTSGTVVNFAVQYVDVTSLTVTPSGTTPITAVYNFQDAVLNGTYSITSNVATVNVTGHDLVVGQKVRLAFSSGTAPFGVYTVASVINANSYTVNITTGNTSGNVSTYPQGFRIFLFNSAGARVSGTASWSVKGY